MRPTAELVIDAQADDRAAFAELVRRYQRAVIATAWSVLQNHHSAEEIAQDSFLIAFRQLGRLRDPATFGPWLMTITRREAVRRSSTRSGNVPIESVEVTASPTDFSSRAEEFEGLIMAVGRLPEHEREVVTFHYLDGHSAREIADLTGRSVGTVTKQISRAVGRLRRWHSKVPT